MTVGDRVKFNWEQQFEWAACLGESLVGRLHLVSVQANVN